MVNYGRGTISKRTLKALRDERPWWVDPEGPRNTSTEGFWLDHGPGMANRIEAVGSPLPKRVFALTTLSPRSPSPDQEVFASEFWHGLPCNNSRRSCVIGIQMYLELPVRSSRPGTHLRSSAGRRKTQPQEKRLPSTHVTVVDGRQRAKELPESNKLSPFQRWISILSRCPIRFPANPPQGRVIDAHGKFPDPRACWDMPRPHSGSRGSPPLWVPPMAVTGVAP